MSKKSNVFVISLAGLGNSLLTSIALKKIESSNKEFTIYVSNHFVKSIYKYYLKNCHVRVFTQKNRLIYLGVLIDLFFSKKNEIIIEPNTSSLFTSILKLIYGNKVKFCKERNDKPIEDDYKKIFNIKGNILDKVKLKFFRNDRILIYPTVESNNKFSKKITEIQLDLIIDYLKKINLRYQIIIPLYEKNQITLDFINKHNSQIKFIDKFFHFKNLIQFFNEYDIYVGGDTFYYHLMTKALNKKSFTFFGSTSYRRFVYRNELTKYFYPDCPNYPTYNKYFSKIKYCNHCETNYCIEKLNVKSLDIELTK